MHGKGCDMRGMLSFQILWLLSKRSMHGEELAREIGARRGEKPKPGSLYPALKELHANGLVNGERCGKSVTYSITSSGRTAVRESTLYFIRSFGDIFEDSKAKK